MLTKTVLVVAMCSIGATVAASAQDEARIFQYSPIAQLVGEGQYRAEVWRRENASGKEERAWSSPDLLGSSDEAIAAACAVLRENFAFTCSQTSRNAKAAEPVKASATVVTKDAKPPQAKAAKVHSPAALPVPAAKAVSAPNAISAAPKAVSAAPKPISAPNAISAATKPGPNHWDNDLWSNQSRFGGGSGGGSQ